MTKFIDATKEVEKEQEKRETIFSEVLGYCSWLGTTSCPKDFEEVMYLGIDVHGSDLFRTVSFRGQRINLFRGTKGDEFK